VVRDPRQITLDQLIEAAEERERVAATTVSTPLLPVGTGEATYRMRR